MHGNNIPNENWIVGIRLMNVYGREQKRWERARLEKVKAERENERGTSRVESETESVLLCQVQAKAL